MKSDYANQIKALLSSKAFFDAKKKLFTKKAESNLSLKDLLYLRAVTLRYLGETELALENLDQLISNFPDYARAYQELGYNYMEINQEERAKLAFTRAANLNPSLHASWMMLVKLSNPSSEIRKLAESNILYLKSLAPELKSVLSFIYEKKLLKADHLCRSFLQQHPHNVEGMRLLANIGLELSIYEDAEFLLESCLEFDPENLRASFDYLKVLIKRQKYEQAVIHAEKLADLHPRSMPVKKMLAHALNGAGRLDDALSLYQDILNTERNNPEIFLAIGHIQKTQGYFEKAVASYQTAYKKNRFFGEAYWSLSNLKTYHFSRDEISDLTEMTTDQLVDEQEQKYMHFALGTAYEESGHYDEAFEQFIAGNRIQNKSSAYTQEVFIKE